jgi:hypothetical protein
MPQWGNRQARAIFLAMRVKRAFPKGLFAAAILDGCTTYRQYPICRADSSPERRRIKKPQGQSQKAKPKWLIRR